MIKIPFNSKLIPSIQKGKYKIVNKDARPVAYRGSKIYQGIKTYIFAVWYPDQIKSTEVWYDHPEHHLFLVRAGKPNWFEKIIDNIRCKRLSLNP